MVMVGENYCVLYYVYYNDSTLLHLE